MCITYASKIKANVNRNPNQILIKPSLKQGINPQWGVD